MSDQNTVPVPDSSQTPASSAPTAKDHRKGRGSLFLPMALIVVGLVLLVNNFHIGLQFNWWAIFIFIPVVASLNTAWSVTRQTGIFNTAAAGALGGAVMVGTIAMMLLLGFDWAIWWPLTILAAGASVFINGIPSLYSGSSVTGSWLHWWMWIGIGGMLLGLGFLAISLPIPAIKTLITGYTWWAVPILVAGLGALISALVFSVRNQGKLGWTGWGLILAGGVTLVVGALAFYQVRWSILLPVALIAAGIIIMTGVLRKQ